MTWQLIATAPMSTPILLYESGMMIVGELELFTDRHGKPYQDEKFSWVNVAHVSGHEFDNDVTKPTHWMPLPEPPESP